MTARRGVPVAHWRELRRAARRHVTVAVLVVGVELALRARVPLPTLSRWLGAPFSTQPAAVARPRQLPRWARQELAVVECTLSRWPFGDTCLRRCLVAGHRLRSLSPVLVIGVRREAGELKAHSWLEIDGMTLDPGAGTFQPLQGGR